MDHVAPEFRKKAFHCPTCTAFASMRWLDLYPVEDDEEVWLPREFQAAICQGNDCVSIWISGRGHKTGKMLSPASTYRGPKPNEDMPDTARDLYKEAGKVFEGSPRAAAALLRMCTEDVIKSLTKKLPERTSLAKRIDHLRENTGLWPDIDDALMAVRLIGNKAVHSTRTLGDDSPQTVAILFELVNVIVNSLVTQRKNVRHLRNLAKQR